MFSSPQVEHFISDLTFPYTCSYAIEYPSCACICSYVASSYHMFCGQASWGLVSPLGSGRQGFSRVTHSRNPHLGQYRCLSPAITLRPHRVQNICLSISPSGIGTSPDGLSRVYPVFCVSPSYSAGLLPFGRPPKISPCSVRGRRRLLSEQHLQPRIRSRE